MKKEKITVVALGGSVVYPYNLEGGGLNIPFLKTFRQFIVNQAKKGKKFIIVIGGGKAARMYQQAAREASGCPVECSRCQKKCLDLIGIEVTKINAQLVKFVLGDAAYHKTMDIEPKKAFVAAFLKSGKKILVGSGWEPGWSTDYDAIKSAIIFGQNEVIMAGDTAFVCDRDPNKFADAKPIKTIKWADYQKLIPAKWMPGLKSPIDPEAAKLAKKNGITVKTIKGSDLGNFERVIDGMDFEGTIITK